MTDLSLSSLRRGGQALMEELAREQYLAYAGFKPTAELQAIYERHADVLTPDALALVREAWRDGDGEGEDWRGARLLLAWQVEAHVQRRLAGLEEQEIAWESSAIVLIPDGRRIPYQRIAIEIANCAERPERLALDRARADLVASELGPIREERFQREREDVESLDIASGYISTFDALSGVQLAPLVDACRDFLRDTQPMWDDTLRDVVRRRLGISPAEAHRSDALALLRASEFDPGFPGRGMEPAVRRQLSEMGLDPEAGGRVIFDTGEREGKRSRAFCAPVRVPEEVYLVLRPHGGQSDWRALLHELGHALHFAHAREEYPFEYRWLGDNSVTEGYAMLFDHLLHSPRWLGRYSDLGRNELSAFRRSAGFEELHFLRRYCAKLIYEHALYGGEAPWSALPGLYVDLLTDATGFRYDAADAFVDVDPGFYAARYLRAWQLQSVLQEALTARFDDDWFRNPRAGPWIVREMFAEGQRELADELSQRVARRALGFEPLVRATESLLASS
ncbi:MAG: hypothetical protein M3068_09770 [Gemmatimonadota bacterium]|nr:hypothetical protein [Gemmatimonadota bacterium]